MDSDYTDDLVLLANTSAQAKCLLHSLVYATRGISLYVNSDKIEFMSFKQDGVSSTINGKPLKLVYQFTYLGCNILSTESDVSICIGKAWTAIIRFSTIWKSDLSDKIRILPSCSCISTIVWQHHLNFNCNIIEQLIENWNWKK